MILGNVFLAIKAKNLQNESKCDCDDIKLAYEKRFGDLNSKFANLTQEYSSLNISYVNLNNTYDNLLKTHQKLEENNSELRTTYSSLSSQYDNLLMFNFNNSNECPPTIQNSYNIYIYIYINIIYIDQT